MLDLTLYLHLGRGKTGSTALQAWLFENRELLAQQGLHYLRSGDSGGGHQSLAKSFIQRPPTYMTMKFDREKTLRDCGGELRSIVDRDIIISSENLPQADPEETTAFLKGHAPNHTICLVYFARSQDELVESEYNQMVKWTGETQDFHQFANNEPAELRFDEELLRWTTPVHVSDARVAVFDAARRDTVTQFCELIQRPTLATGPAAPGSTKNTGVGRFSLEIYRLLNEVDLPNRREIYRKIQHQLLGIDHPPVYFSGQQAEDYRQRFAASNQRFSRQFLGAESADLGGRKYSPTERDELIEQWKLLTRHLPVTGTST